MTYKRLFSIFLAVLIIVSSLAFALPVMANNSNRTLVKPFIPLKTVGVGDATVKLEKIKLFENSDLAVMSSENEIGGLPIEKTETVDKGYMVVTPLVSGSQISFNSSTVTASMVAVTDKTSEKGVKIVPSPSLSGGKVVYADNEVGNSLAYSGTSFSKKNSFDGCNGIMFYVKTDAANRIVPCFSSFIPENASRWSYSYNPDLFIKVGAEYSYMPFNATKWTTSKATEGKKGSQYFGSISFNSAFEGWIKIPFSSLGNDLGFKFNTSLDSFERIYIKFKGLGGEYGNSIAGPFFAINNDSASTVMQVNDSPASVVSTNIGVKFTGIEEKLDEVEGLLVYANVPSTNILTVSAQVKDDYISSMPDLQIKAGTKIYTLAKGASKWQEVTSIDTASGAGAIKFEKGFEGYIKIPMSSLVAASVPNIAILPELDSLIGVQVNVAGLGGKFGSVKTIPFVITDYTSDTSFAYPDGYVIPDIKPDSMKIEIINPESTQSIFQGTAELVTPLSWAKDAQGVKVTAKSDVDLAHTLEAYKITTRNWYNSNPISLANATHILLYVKTPAATQLQPRATVVGKGDAALKVGANYEYASVNDTEWSVGTTVKGGNNTYFSDIKFDGPFEGYIKIKISDFYSDNGWNIDPSTHKIERLDVWFSKLAKDESVIAGPVFKVTKNTDSVNFELPPSEPMIVETINPESTQSIFQGTAELVTPLSWAKDAQGVKVTAKSDVDLAHTLEAYKITARNWYNSNPISLANATHILLYVKTPAATQLQPRATVVGKGDAALKVGANYEYASVNDTEWSVGTTVKGGNNTYFSDIKFDGPFEGYIKIRISDFYSDNGWNINPSIHKIERLDVWFSKLAKDESVIAGPVFKVTKNTDSMVIKFPGESEEEKPGEEEPGEEEDKYISENTYDRIQEILQKSKAGTAQGYFFMVGDSTRALLGSPVFRLVRHRMINDYNMKCYLQAQGGLKAEHWSDYSKNLQPNAPYVEQLIDQIPGTGMNCIVDISLGINDSDKEAAVFAEYIKKGIAKIRAAKPNAVIVYTSPNLIAYNDNNKRMKEAAEIIWKDKSVFAIDVITDTFEEYYPQYNVDSHHPNVDGHRIIAKYICSKYFGDIGFEKVGAEVIDDGLTLPSGASIISTKFSVRRSLNVKKTAVKFKVGNQITGGVLIDGTTEINGDYPYNARNFVEALFDEVVTGIDYIAFHINVPTPNTVGITCHTKQDGKDDRENIFKNNLSYFVMEDGSNKWSKKVAVAGRSDNFDTYGGMKFEKAFSGWVKVPLSNFYGSPTAESLISKVTFNFGKLGEKCGQIKIGSFLSIKDEPYTAKNVWKKSDLPEMTPFTPIVSVLGAPWVNKYLVDSPIPSLTDNKALMISVSPKVDYDITEFMDSNRWAGMKFNSMPIGAFSHIMIYVKVPAAKDNMFSLCMFTETHFEFKVMVNQSYQLLPLGSNTWEHYTAFKCKNDYGGIALPAGFEGFIKVPLNSLLPANKVTNDTVFDEMHYRFSYNGADEDAVMVGPIFGVTKDNDPGPSEIVYTSMPTPTTIKSLFEISKEDIFADRIMLYWEAYEGASSYLMEAYSITNVENGTEYRLEASNVSYTNSGTITGLMPGRKYAVLVKARDFYDKVIAVYDYTVVTTLEENPYPYPVVSDEMSFDKVYYLKESASNTGAKLSGLLPVIVAVSSAIAATGIAVGAIVLYKRRKNNVK